ncbi:flagellar protein FliT [Marinobacterium arenosum]|uniref:flagellar protein FliT n=1 Tax=Marinobacterium arenosum TaxID=2862496 RepID=UPI001C940A17|nr:flagellar protein FliT [Marinobacterium arenosum]MBY4675929.1 flagellar protein FliT [Marinobacterium arenosum]
MLQTLEQALTLTHQLTELAAEQKWLEFEQLQQQRSELIARIADQAPPPEDAGRVRELIHQIQQIDQQLIAQAQARRQQVVEEKKKLNQGGKAAKAYRAFK